MISLNFAAAPARSLFDRGSRRIRRIKLFPSFFFLLTSNAACESAAMAGLRRLRRETKVYGQWLCLFLADKPFHPNHSEISLWHLL